MSAFFLIWEELRQIRAEQMNGFKDHKSRFKDCMSRFKEVDLNITWNDYMSGFIEQVIGFKFKIFLKSRPAS